jgi:hypothetical protein
MVAVDRRRFWIGGLAAAAAAPWLSTPAYAQLVRKFAEELRNGEFNWFPERSPDGPILIIVSIPDQLLHVYRNGIRIAASTCSTGKPGHATPTGVFQILQKDKHHRSSTYNNAPMPNMNRLTWSGIALHAGQLPGYPASHGCVRLPLAFSEKLFEITKLGLTVVIADETAFPTTVAHPGMVLGEYARREFRAVDTALMHRAYSEGHETQPSTTSFVVSRPDRKVTILEDGKVVANGKAEIAERDKPVGNRVYTLAGTDELTASLRWFSAAYGGPGADLITGEDPLRRITMNEDLREEGRRRMHLGMSFVVTDEPAGAQTRSNDDFVVIEGIS